MEVRPIKKIETEPWLLKKHYARRMPSIMYAYGLYENGELVGVVTYGMTANNNLNTIGDCEALELNRLCVSSKSKNASSMLVGRSLKMLPQPKIIISYADTGQGHIGYIYQATNWIYTGIGKGDVEFEMNGRRYHRKLIYDRLGTGSEENAVKHGYKPVKVLPKHRYLYICADKKRKKEILNSLPWPILPYPKGETKRYDAGGKVATQRLMF